MHRNSREIAHPGMSVILNVQRAEPLAGRLLKPWEDVITVKKLLVGLFVLSLCSIAGCKSFYGDLIGTAISKESGKLHFTTYEKFHVCPRCIKEKGLVGSLETADVNVAYQRGLEAQADCAAEHFNGLLDEVERKTGFRISCRTKFYLFRVDKIPQHIDVQLKVDVNELEFPLFVKADDESCRTIFAQNAAYPGAIVHELAEFSLILPKETGNVLPDAQGRFLLLPITVRKYTRWFREGFANYAGYTKRLPSLPLAKRQVPLGMPYGGRIYRHAAAHTWAVTADNPAEIIQNPATIQAAFGRVCGRESLHTERRLGRNR